MVNYRIRTNCEPTFVIQNVCLPPWKIGTCTSGTTWFPCKTTTRRATHVWCYANAHTCLNYANWFPRDVNILGLALMLDATQIGFFGMLTFLELAHMFDATQIGGFGMLTFLELAHMFDATQIGFFRMLTFLELAHMFDAAQIGAFGMSCWRNWSNRIPSVDYQLRPVEDVWSGTLACIMDCPLWARSSSTFDFDFVLWTTYDNIVKLLVTSVRVTNSPHHKRCATRLRAFSLHGYFVVSWNLLCENGGVLLDSLASIWWMGVRICLIYASRMTFSVCPLTSRTGAMDRFIDDI